MTDLKRNLLKNIDELLNYFPIVILLGVRQCGKTTLARQARPGWKYFDLENGNDFDRISEDFEFFIKQHSQEIIIDEAQKYPNLFQELRGVIDKNRKQKNRFLLTGSSSFELIKNVSESLAGRVGIIELGTFKTNEILSKPLPAFYQIFENRISTSTTNKLYQLKSEIKHDQVMNTFLKGGYPEPVLNNDQRFFNLWMENYFQTYIQRDIRSLFPKLDLVRFRRFISMLSSLNGTIVNRSQVGRSLDCSDVTIRDYLEIAAGSYIWRIIHSYEKNIKKTVVKMPKGSFRDTGLSHYILGHNSLEALNNAPNVGSSFESFVIEEIIKGLQATVATRWNYYYYRTRNGAEIDLVLDGEFGLLPIEIKYGTSTRIKQLQSLKRFVFDNDLPIGIVINNSDSVELLTERIVQLPVTFI
ncbi:MAG: ATP-binding protein [Deltaproteobacteria bacterium]|jgi:uncharacterized protein|nr:ATP-binding protein [Deltaproteobacteria bacterium]